MPKGGEIMADFFGHTNINTSGEIDHQSLSAKYNSSRFGLLWVVFFSTINIVSMVAGGGSRFLSAFVPQTLINISMYLCGMLPEKTYSGKEPFTFVDKSLFWGALAVSVTVVAFYLLCFVMSKKKSGWLFSGFVFFIIDTVLMFLLTGISMGMIWDYLFHAWVIVTFYMGMSAAGKLKTLKSVPKNEFLDNDIESDSEHAEDEV